MNKVLQLGTFAILNRESTGSIGNTDIVIDFKLALVSEFYCTHCFPLEIQTAEWQQSRIVAKQVRLQETDVIMTKLISLPESQDVLPIDRTFSHLVYPSVKLCCRGVLVNNGHLLRTAWGVDQIDPLASFERW